METRLMELPPDLPAPADDGRAMHLAGMRLPSIELPSTAAAMVDLSAVRGRAAVFAYPRTGVPGRPPLVPEWDRIAGARGCTPQTCGYRDLYEEFLALRCRAFGLSTQDLRYQSEMAERLVLPFPILSDARLELARAIWLPTFRVAGQELLARLAWVQRDGVIERVFYPVFPPDRNAAVVLDWLRDNP